MAKKITKETELKRAAVQMLKVFDIKTWAVPASPYGRSGMPDRIGIYKDRFLALEFKSPKGKLSDEQLKIKAEMEEAGALYLVVRSLQDIAVPLNLPVLFQD